MMLFIATPSATGRPHDEYNTSLQRALVVLAEHGVEVTLAKYNGQPCISEARNNLVAQFLKSSCSHLLFIDDDMEFHAIDVLRLIEHQVPLVAGAGPVKSLKPTGLARYCCNLLPDSLPHPTKPLVEALSVGAAFMLIQRQVFDQLSWHDMVKQYDTGKELTDYQSEFFARRIMADDQGRNRSFSEDYSFCNLYRSIGGTVWVDTLCELGHIGKYVYRAPTLHDTLLELEHET